MKIIFISILLFSWCSLHAQMKDDSLFIPDVKGFGITNGDLINKQIGSGGGKIVSSDGRVELIFPPGALNLNTSITIQPTTNVFDSTAGQAYRFEPSGIQFKKPVTVIFHYSDEENQTCPA